VTDRIALSSPSPAARSCVRLVQHRAVPSVPWSTVRGVLVLPDDVRASDPDDREGDGVGRGLREIIADEAFRSLECPDVGDAERDVQEERGQEPGLYLSPAILDTITPCMTDCMIPKIAGLKPSDFLWGNRMGKM
jgi:hypothetical protein